MNLQPPTYALDLNIDEYVPQAIPLNQNRWRMPDERMELMCQSLTRAGQEKQFQSSHRSKRAHCTQTPTLPSHEMDFLVNTVVAFIRVRGQLYSNNVIFTRLDWDIIRQIFNRRFELDTKLSVLECAMRKERYKYVIALFRARCERAKVEQPELGEEYWHWMEV